MRKSAVQSRHWVFVSFWLRRSSLHLCHGIYIRMAPKPSTVQHILEGSKFLRVIPVFSVLWLGKSIELMACPKKAGSDSLPKTHDCPLRDVDLTRTLQTTLRQDNCGRMKMCQLHACLPGPGDVFCSANIYMQRRWAQVYVSPWLLCRILKTTGS